MPLSDIDKIEVGNGGGVMVPPVTIHWKDGSIQEIRLHTNYTHKQAASRIAEMILLNPKKKELEKLRADLLKLMDAA